MQVTDHERALLDEIPGLPSEVLTHLLDIVRSYKESILATQEAVTLRNADLVADLKRAEETTRANELRFRHLFENVPLCIFEEGVT